MSLFAVPHQTLGVKLFILSPAPPAGGSSCDWDTQWLSTTVFHRRLRKLHKQTVALQFYIVLCVDRMIWTFEIEPNVFEQESDVEYDSGQDKRPQQQKLLKLTLLLTDVTDHSPLCHSLVWSKSQYTVTTATVTIALTYTDIL